MPWLPMPYSYGCGIFRDARVDLQYGRALRDRTRYEVQGRFLVYVLSTGGWMAQGGSSHIASAGMDTDRHAKGHPRKAAVLV